MECENCHQVSDWIGDESEWKPVTDDATVVRGLYECENCGHTQRMQ